MVIWVQDYDGGPAFVGWFGGDNFHGCHIGTVWALCQQNILVVALPRKVWYKGGAMCLSYHLIRCVEITTRKAARCEWCAHVIGKGERAQLRVYVFDGQFNNGRMHPECYKAYTESDTSVICEGWMAGDFERGEGLESGKTEKRDG